LWCRLWGCSIHRWLVWCQWVGKCALFWENNIQHTAWESLRIRSKALLVLVRYTKNPRVKFYAARSRVSVSSNAKRPVCTGSFSFNQNQCTVNRTTFGGVRRVRYLYTGTVILASTVPVIPLQHKNAAGAAGASATSSGTSHLGSAGGDASCMRLAGSQSANTTSRASTSSSTTTSNTSSTTSGTTTTMYVLRWKIVSCYSTSVSIPARSNWSCVRSLVGSWLVGNLIRNASTSTSTSTITTDRFVSPPMLLLLVIASSAAAAAAAA